MNQESCDKFIFEKGRPIAILCCQSIVDINAWLQIISMMTKFELDWYENAGHAQVLYIGNEYGDKDKHKRLIQTMSENKKMFKGGIKHFCPFNGQSLPKNNSKTMSRKCH
jgi:hypothetical protein